MTEPKDSGWPKPYLLQLYDKAVNEGCIRVLLHGDETRFKSLKASFYRLRRRSDVQSVALMRPEYYLTTMLWEPERGTALIIYNQLPDGQELPEIESVHDKTPIPVRLPPQAAPPPLLGITPVDEPDEFDATDHVAKMLDNIKFDEEGDDATSDL